MKRILLMMMAAMMCMCAFTSCGGDDEPDNTGGGTTTIIPDLSKDPTLIGTWRRLIDNGTEELVFTSSYEFTLNTYERVDGDVQKTSQSGIYSYSKESSKIVLRYMEDGVITRSLYYTVGLTTSSLTLTDDDDVSIVYQKLGSDTGIGGADVAN